MDVAELMMLSFSLGVTWRDRIRRGLDVGSDNFPTTCPSDSSG